MSKSSARPLRADGRFRPARHAKLPLACWRVSIARHELAGRWTIPAGSVVLPAADAEMARLLAVREAHSAVGAPPHLAAVAESMVHTTARRTM